MRHVFRRPSKMLRPEILIAALIFLLANGYRPGFAGVEGEESDKATAISNRMDKVRADLEKEIAPLNSKPLLRKGSFAPSSKNSRADRIDAALFHRFRTGQVFGYRVEIEIPGNSQTERFVGSPIFTVYAVDEEGCAEMFVNGKLENSLRRHQTETENANTKRDVWIGSWIVVDTHGKCIRSKDDVNEKKLPDYLISTVKLKELLFPGLTASTTGEHREVKSAMLWTTPVTPAPMVTPPSTMSGGLKIAKFVPVANWSVGPSVESGTQLRAIRCVPESDRVVRLHKERGFVGKVAPKTIVDFKSDYRFDRGLGLLLESSATIKFVSDGKTSTAAVRTRLLEGEELRKARAKADDDWKTSPEALDPFELKRIRLSAKSYPRMTAGAARVGMVVPHFRDPSHFPDGDHRWYWAEVVKILSPRELEVRYLGSREEFKITTDQVGVATGLKPPKP